MIAVLPVPASPMTKTLNVYSSGMIGIVGAGVSVGVGGGNGSVD